MKSLVWTVSLLTLLACGAPTKPATGEPVPVEAEPVFQDDAGAFEADAGEPTLDPAIPSAISCVSLNVCTEMKVAAKEAAEAKDRCVGASGESHDGPCSRDKVIATCTLPNNKALIFYYEDDNADMTRGRLKGGKSGCATAKGKFAVAKNKANNVARLADLRLDEATWQSGSDLRRAEWRVVRDELLEDGDFADAWAGLYVLATPSAEAVTLEALDEEGFVRHAGRLPRTLLAESVREYAAIIRRLDENADHRDATWVEAVDMAKKVVHDRAAAVIASIAPELGSDKATLRRVFTFYFTLVVDTTRMQHARSHHVSR